MQNNPSAAAANLAQQTIHHANNTTKFSDNYEVKEELGKRVCVGAYVEEKVRKLVDAIWVRRDSAMKIERK